MRLWHVLVGIAIVILAGAAYALPHYYRLAFIGVGYASDQTCACLFVSGRKLESCKTDLDPAAQKLVSLSVGSDEVTARVPLLARRTARFTPGFGCAVTD